MLQINSTTYLYSLATALLASSTLGAEYTVRVDDTNPLVAKATLLLPPSKGQPHTLVVQGAEWGLQMQVSEVCGDESPLTKNDKGRWVAPADCRRVTWKIHFHDSAAAPVQASSQQSVFFRDQRWWLISEPTTLLRLEGTKEESTIEFEPRTTSPLGAVPSGQNRWRLPAPGHAPEFFVVGHKNAQEIDIDGFRVTYVSDDSQRIGRLGIQDRHVAAFRYLLKLFPQSVDVPKAEKRLMVVWIGVDASNRYVGGASGSRSFIANYVYGEPTRTDDYAAASLMVVAHEQFHQLTSLCIQHETSLPTWVNESLAQYYGLKTLAHSGLPMTVATRARERFIAPDRTVEKGLAELSRQYQRGDRSVYPLFYSQGATFWAEIDQALLMETDGEKSLDDFLPILFRANFNDQTHSVPESLSNPLREAIGDRLDDLLQQYVGS